MAEASTDDQRIGFVGIGTMGFPMAENLLSAGYSVTAFDVHDDTLETFEDVGGSTANDPREVARACRSVHVVVSNDEQARAVVFGDDGLFAGFEASDHDEHVLVLHSTLVPGTVLDLSEDAPDSVSILDAPMSGGQAASTGELTFMVGGDSTTVDRHMPIFEVMGSDVIYLGPVGAGMTAKLTNNLIHHSIEVATLEALEIGNEFGIDREDLLEAYVASSGNSRFARNYNYFTDDILRTYPGGANGFAGNVKKNLKQALELAYDLEVDVPLAGHVSQEAPRWFRELGKELDSE